MDLDQNWQAGWEIIKRGINYYQAVIIILNSLYSSQLSGRLKALFYTNPKRCIQLMESLVI